MMRFSLTSSSAAVVRKGTLGQWVMRGLFENPKDDLAIETDLGEAFLRLRAAKAEKREAKRNPPPPEKVVKRCSFRGEEKDRMITDGAGLFQCHDCALEALAIFERAE
jgi:hypothetical protein